MLVYIVRRTLIAIPVLFAASLFVFLMADTTGDPLLELQLAQPPVAEEVIAAEAERLYLDRSVPERYWLWVTGIGGNGDIGLLQGEWGPSVRSASYDIGAEIGSRLWVTLRLVTASLFLSIGFGILTGVISALRQYSKLDYGLTFIGFTLLAMPSFWVAALLREAGVWINQQRDGPNIFWTIGASSPDTRNFSNWELFTDAAGHLILPTLALFLAGYAALSRYQRASMLEVMNSDYVRLAKAKGLRHGTVVRRHALRTALIPVTTLSLLLIAGTIDGAVLVETVFQWQGLGIFLVESIQRRDSYAVMGFLMLSGILVIVANLIADILYGVLDPRIRYE
jgi:peptide/nickel transport system permease protein